MSPKQPDTPTGPDEQLSARPAPRAGESLRRIVDPHHHLWSADFMGGLAGEYQLEQLRADTSTVPAVTSTIFMECGAGYRSDGPGHLMAVGETEWVAAIAEGSTRTEGASIIGIVAHADLSLPLDQLDEVLDAHEHAGRGLFCGIRDALASAPANTPLMIPGPAPAGKSEREDFRRGVRRLGKRGLTYDTWHYHTQNREFIDLARAVPETTMILDHFGTPLGVGEWAGRHDEIFETWKRDMEDLATCENVMAKLGGLAMPDNGFWPLGGPRPDVEAFLAVQRRWYEHMIEAFGPNRCMFESNFPVDKFSVDYRVVWEAFEELTSSLGTAERQALFADTALTVYGLQP